MTITQLSLALTVEYAPHYFGHVEPHRRAVERAQADARAALDAFDADARGTIGWDCCEEAVTRLDLYFLYDVRHEIECDIRDAVHRRKAYDTWDPKALRVHIDALQQLRDALSRLIRTRENLERAEWAQLTIALGRVG